MKKDVIKKWLRDEYCFKCHWYLKCLYQPRIIAQETIKQAGCAAKIDWNDTGNKAGTLAFVPPPEFTCDHFEKPHGK